MSTLRRRRRRGALELGRSAAAVGRRSAVGRDADLVVDAAVFDEQQLGARSAVSVQTRGGGRGRAVDEAVMGGQCGATGERASADLDGHRRRDAVQSTSQ